jgi:hypothetical protein
MTEALHRRERASPSSAIGILGIQGSTRTRTLATSLDKPAPDVGAPLQLSFM